MGATLEDSATEWTDQEHEVRDVRALTSSQAEEKMYRISEPALPIVYARKFGVNTNDSSRSISPCQLLGNVFRVTFPSSCSR